MEKRERKDSDIEQAIKSTLLQSYRPRFTIVKNNRGHMELQFTIHNDSTIRRLCTILSDFAEPEWMSMELYNMYTSGVMSYLNRRTLGNQKWPFDQFMDSLHEVIRTLEQQNPDVDEVFWDKIAGNFTKLMYMTQKIPCFTGGMSADGQLDLQLDLVHVINEVTEKFCRRYYIEVNQKDKKDLRLTLHDWFDSNLCVHFVCRPRIDTNGKFETDLEVLSNSATVYDTTIRTRSGMEFVFRDAIILFRSHTNDFAQWTYLQDADLLSAMQKIAAEYYESNRVFNIQVCDKLSREFTALLDRPEFQYIRNDFQNISDRFSLMFNVDMDQRLV